MINQVRKVEIGKILAKLSFATSTHNLDSLLFFADFAKLLKLFYSNLFRRELNLCINAYICNVFDIQYNITII